MGGGGGCPRASVRRFLSGLQVEGRTARGGDEAEMRARALARFYAMIQTVFVLTAWEACTGRSIGLNISEVKLISSGGETITLCTFDNMTFQIICIFSRLKYLQWLWKWLWMRADSPLQQLTQTKLDPAQNQQKDTPDPNSAHTELMHHFGHIFVENF